MTLIIMPAILPLLDVRKLDVSVSKVKYPKIIIEATSIAIPMNSNTTVIVHDHLFPFNNP
jgi:hypothetical protein